MIRGGKLLNAELDTCTKVIVAKTIENGQLIQSIKALEKELAKSKSVVEKLESDVTRLTSESTRLNKEVDRKSADCERYYAERTDLATQVAALKARVEKLETDASNELFADLAFLRANRGDRRASV